MIGVLMAFGCVGVQFINHNANVAYFASEECQNAEEIDSEIASVEPYEEKMAAGGIITEYVIIESAEYEGVKLTRSAGRIQGPSGEETYYNLPMGKVIDNMRTYGYTVEEYPYWTREDGCKMLGEYIMIAADYDIRPVGTKVQTSLGMGIVCDTGRFAMGKTTTNIDIATNW